MEEDGKGRRSADLCCRRFRRRKVVASGEPSTTLWPDLHLHQAAADHTHMQLLLQRQPR